MKGSTSKNDKWVTLSAIVTLLFIWWIASLFYPPIILPSPAETAGKALSLFREGKLLGELVVTLRRVLLAFTISLMVGTVAGAMIGKTKNLYLFVKPIITIVQTIPPISWIILAIIWMGLGGGAPIFVVMIATFPIFFFNAAHGINQVSKELLEMSEIFQVKRHRQLLDVYLPSLWPFISSAISICIGISWKTIVMAELLSSNSGVGASLGLARLQLETSEVLAWTLTMVIVGVTCEQLFQMLSDKTTVGKMSKCK
ncbi:NitT/TauT family transport system permease protein [Evansella caseinilytica]|uniref:NitT/TauT family transport system permease protein n=1 Tax=Evansella caseinilytica TaxID=1503961 RepID=A0A1H3RYZ8_9BACI|nr:ABC transporter permease [Evansella caseinilytica]SDZ30912.1 NitT/TauT family transport system permease protein [Evansella caseinilytica]